jgi:hypothetical protein
MNDRYPLTGVVHLVRPVGERAHDLGSLRESLTRVPDRSLFLHTRMRMLHRPDAPELPPDDVSHWVAVVLHDRETAERLSYAAEFAGGAAETLRTAWLGVLDEVPERVRTTHTAPRGAEFIFLTAESVTVPSGVEAADTRELMDALATADSSVWFWHLVEEPWQEHDRGSLVRWLETHDAGRLAEGFVAALDSGRPLAELRRALVRRWRLSGLGTRVAAAARQSPTERERAGRDAVASLTRRLRGQERV